jgi:hypothetical protein
MIQSRFSSTSFKIKKHGVDTRIPVVSTPILNTEISTNNEESKDSHVEKNVSENNTQSIIHDDSDQSTNAKSKTVSKKKVSKKVTKKVSKDVPKKVTKDVPKKVTKRVPKSVANVPKKRTNNVAKKSPQTKKKMPNSSTNSKEGTAKKKITIEDIFARATNRKCTKSMVTKKYDDDDDDSVAPKHIPKSESTVPSFFRNLDLGRNRSHLTHVEDLFPDCNSIAMSLDVCKHDSAKCSIVEWVKNVLGYSPASSYDVSQMSPQRRPLVIYGPVGSGKSYLTHYTFRRLQQFTKDSCAGQVKWKMVMINASQKNLDMKRLEYEVQRPSVRPGFMPTHKLIVIDNVSSEDYSVEFSKFVFDLLFPDIVSSDGKSKKRKNRKKAKSGNTRRLRFWPVLITCQNLFSQLVKPFRWTTKSNVKKLYHMVKIDLLPFSSCQHILYRVLEIHECSKSMSSYELNRIIKACTFGHNRTKIDLQNVLSRMELVLQTGLKDTLDMKDGIPVNIFESLDSLFRRSKIPTKTLSFTPVSDVVTECIDDDECVFSTECLKNVEKAFSTSSEPHSNGFSEPHSNGSSEPHSNGFSEPHSNGSSEPHSNGSSEPHSGASVSSSRSLMVDLKCLEEGLNAQTDPRLFQIMHQSIPSVLQRCQGEFNIRKISDLYDVESDVDILQTDIHSGVPIRSLRLTKTLRTFAVASLFRKTKQRDFKYNMKVSPSNPNHAVMGSMQFCGVYSPYQNEIARYVSAMQHDIQQKMGATSAQDKTTMSYLREQMSTYDLYRVIGTYFTRINGNLVVMSRLPRIDGSSKREKERQIQSHPLTPCVKQLTHNFLFESHK